MKKNLIYLNKRNVAAVLSIFDKTFPKHAGSLSLKTASGLVEEYGVDPVVINIGRI